MNADRHPETGWSDLGRLENEQTRLAGANGRNGEREWQHGTRAAPATGSAARGRWTTNPHLTERERGERWPIG